MYEQLVVFPFKKKKQLLVVFEIIIIFHLIVKLDAFPLFLKKRKKKDAFPFSMSIKSLKDFMHYLMTNFQQ